ncbi:hypothetical protein IAU60_002597 [Kwoniella sp. DSM 27419]
MCISFFTLNQPGYKLILASNRDEFLGRPTLPAGWHDFAAKQATTIMVAEGDEPHGWVLSGLDRARPEGGTWLGITRDLRVGLITNVRLTPPKPPTRPSPDPPSRGLLLKHWLAPFATANTGVNDYLSSHVAASAEYEGFNLLLFSISPPGSKDETQVGYLTNRPEPRMVHLSTAPDASIPDSRGDQHLTSPRECSPERHTVVCHGISNSPLDEPWPKVVHGRARMAATLADWQTKGEPESELIERMFILLGHNIPITSEQDMKLSTSIPLINLAPGSVTTSTANPADAKTRYYGTRLSTVILVTDDGRVTFVERDVLVLGDDGPTQGQKEAQRWFEFEAESRPEVPVVA